MCARSRRCSVFQQLDSVCVGRRLARVLRWEPRDLSDIFAMVVEFMADRMLHKAIAFGIGQRFRDTTIDDDFWDGGVVFGAQLALTPSAEIRESHGDTVFACQPECRVQSERVICANAAALRSRLRFSVAIGCDGFRRYDPR